ncbi:MAG: type II toxin-antitoxin system HicA family toxin [Ignavibacteriales bacterium]|nr:type II toxin-antitoxin system HicA family toxin [Ignavibacteriales bacterium]
MAKSPSLTGKEIIKALENAGFGIIRIKGSHYFLQHPDGRCTTIPVHSKEVIGIGLFHKILSDCELTLKEFLKLL